MVPALADVRALRALADRMQTQRTCQPLQAVVVFAERRTCLQPFGLGRGRFARGLNLHQIYDGVQHFFIVEVRFPQKLRCVPLGARFGAKKLVLMLGSR